MNPIKFKIPQESSVIGIDQETSSIHNPVLRVALDILKFLTIVIPLKNYIYKKIIPACILPGSRKLSNEYKEKLKQNRQSF